MLQNAILKPIYASGEDEPLEFFLEVLMNSSSLDLGLGYFSSSAINTLSVGFAYFIKHGGKIRILINDFLSPEDKSAIMEGTTNEHICIEERIINNILELRATLSRRNAHFFKCLSWLVATKRLEIKATIPKNSSFGIVHQKFGIFTDNVDSKVIFTGSTNFSKSALLYNVEDIWCDFSWDSDRSRQRVSYLENIFYKGWTGTSDVLKIIPIERVKEVIKSHFPVADLQELIEDEVSLIEDDIQKFGKGSAASKQLQKMLSGIFGDSKEKSPQDFPRLRDYQLTAIEKWFANQNQGIFEMATGTGKTFTALTAILKLYKQAKKLFVIISCPFIHLAEQWQEEAAKFGLRSLLIGESKEFWENDAARQSQLFKRNKLDMVVFITTNSSFKADNFQNIITPNLEHLLLVIDEVHYAGAYSIRNALPSQCKYRLGLSATPRRHGDDEGTTALFSYFNKIVFSFPIEEAIGKYLTEYYYRPVPVELTTGEFEEYCDLTLQMSRLAGKTDDISADRLEKLAIKRARVQNNSVNKLEWLRENMRGLPLDYSLFYAGDLIFPRVKQLLGKELKINLHEFTSRQSRAERKQLLKDFEDQKVQSLIAMKCLDEGVDIPPTRTAYFLASSGNPREFIQRRGRILRQSPGKEYATIYDLISIPPKDIIREGREGKKYNAARSAFAKEYRRVNEFARLAINRYDSLNEMFGMADELDMLDTGNS